MKALTSIEIAAVVKELRELVNSKVSKIYQPDNEEILFELFKTSVGKFLLRIVPGKTLYITSFKRKNPKEALSFCKFLRKRLTNVKLIKIEQKHFERIVEFTFQTKEDTFYLIAEFFSKGNIIFTDKDYKIISALRVQLWKDRKIKANEIYTYPPKSNVDIFNIKEPEFKKIIKDSEKENIVKTLAVDIGLGGLYSEELCLRTKIDKNKKITKEEDISRLFKELKRFSKLELKPLLYEKDAIPFKLEQYGEGEETRTFNEALDKYYSQFIEKIKEEDVNKIYKDKLKREQKILKTQEKQLEELEKASTFNKEKGDLIYKNYMLLKEVFETIKKARDKNIPWKEIEEKLKTKGIVVNGKEGKVTLELK